MIHTSIEIPHTVELINLEPFKGNPLISKCQIKVCYVGEQPNRNRSIITKEVARAMGETLRSCPIVGFFNEAKQDFEEHNRIIDISNGQFKIKDVTRPYGFVDLNAKVWFQKFLDDGEFEREYLMTEGYIWTGQYPEAQRIIDKGNNHSMELDEENINAFWTKDVKGKPEFFIINEAIISKLCILGEDCEPCFEGASITKLQFSFEEDFKEQLFSMMNEMKQILNEGGTPKMTTYTVEIGSTLWEALFNLATDRNSDLVAVMTAEDTTFAVLQNREDESYSRVNFSFNEETNELTPADFDGEFAYEPAEEPQFSTEAVNAYVEKKKQEEEEDDGEEEKCPKCGKPISECTCEDEDEDKKDKYILEEIPEYIELNTRYSELNAEHETLVSEYATLESTVEDLKSQISTLTKFKAKVEKEQKEDMIASFYMLSDEEKSDVITNIDKYSLDDIEAKLSIICVRNKVNFSLDDDNVPGTDPLTYNFNGSSMEDDTVPAWIRRVQEVAKTMD